MEWGAEKQGSSQLGRIRVSVERTRSGSPFVVRFAEFYCRSDVLCSSLPSSRLPASAPHSPSPCTSQSSQSAWAWTDPVAPRLLPLWQPSPNPRMRSSEPKVPSPLYLGFEIPLACCCDESRSRMSVHPLRVQLSFSLDSIYSFSSVGCASDDCLQ